jgi:hypothetical protein
MRRPRELTDKQKASVEGNAELQEAIQKRDNFAEKLKHSSKKSTKKLNRLDQLKTNVINSRNRLLYDLRKRVREDFDSQQAAIDIERQLAGAALHQEGTKEIPRTEEHMLPEQIFLLEKLTTWPTTLSLEAEWTRRNEAVEALRMYCDVLEGGPRRGRRYAKRRTLAKDDTTVNGDDALPPTVIQPPHTPREEGMREAGTSTERTSKPLQCFQCDGMKHYSRHKHLLRHFRDTHLNDRHCNHCNEAVEHEMGLLRHVHDKHGLKT